jgi:glycosyltransferase involved in cell wall biosynthesis
MVLLVASTPTHINLERARLLHSLSRQLGLEERVKMMIRNLNHKQKQLLYGSAEAFLFAPASPAASAIEPPLSVMESLSMGVPVIATDVLSVNEIISDGKNGFLFPLNEYEAVSCHVNNLIEMDSTERNMLSMYARRKAVEMFSLSAIAKTFGEFHERFI